MIRYLRLARQASNVVQVNVAAFDEVLFVEFENSLPSKVRDKDIRAGFVQEEDGAQSGRG